MYLTKSRIFIGSNTIKMYSGIIRKHSKSREGFTVGWQFRRMDWPIQELTMIDLMRNKKAHTLSSIQRNTVAIRVYKRRWKKFVAIHSQLVVQRVKICFHDNNIILCRFTGLQIPFRSITVCIRTDTNYFLQYISTTLIKILRDQLESGFYTPQWSHLKQLIKSAIEHIPMLPTADLWCQNQLYEPCWLVGGARNQ